MKQGTLIVISGPSGSGKDTVRDSLLDYESITTIKTYTSREPRAIEATRDDYIYISKEEFEKKISNNEFFEYVNYCGNYYGTPKAELMEILKTGKNVILKLNPDGAFKIKEQYPTAVLIMLLAPTLKEQERRLRYRASETEEEIQKRLAETKHEVELAKKYDYIVLNRDLQSCVYDIISIINASQCKVENQYEILENYQ